MPRVNKSTRKLSPGSLGYSSSGSSGSGAQVLTPKPSQQTGTSSRAESRADAMARAAIQAERDRLRLQKMQMDMQRESQDRALDAQRGSERSGLIRDVVNRHLDGGGKLTWDELNKMYPPTHKYSPDIIENPVPGGDYSSVYQKKPQSWRSPQEILDIRKEADASRSRIEAGREAVRRAPVKPIQFQTEQGGPMLNYYGMTEGESLPAQYAQEQADSLSAMAQWRRQAQAPPGGKIQGAEFLPQPQPTGYMTGQDMSRMQGIAGQYGQPVTQEGVNTYSNALTGAMERRGLTQPDTLGRLQQQGLAGAPQAPQPQMAPGGLTDEEIQTVMGQMPPVLRGESVRVGGQQQPLQPAPQGMGPSYYTPAISQPLTDYTKSQQARFEAGTLMTQGLPPDTVGQMIDAKFGQGAFGAMNTPGPREMELVDRSNRLREELAKSASQPQGPMGGGGMTFGGGMTPEREGTILGNKALQNQLRDQEMGSVAPRVVAMVDALPWQTVTPGTPNNVDVGPSSWNVSDTHVAALGQMDQQIRAMMSGQDAAANARVFQQTPQYQQMVRWLTGLKQDDRNTFYKQNPQYEPSPVSQYVDRLDALIQMIEQAAQQGR